MMTIKSKELRKFLLSLSDKLTPDEVKKLAFLHQRDPEETEAFEIFADLIKAGQLSSTDFTTLKELLEAVKRPDLASEVVDKEEYFAQLYLEETQKEQSNAVSAGSTQMTPKLKPTKIPTNGIHQPSQDEDQTTTCLKEPTESSENGNAAVHTHGTISGGSLPKAASSSTHTSDDSLPKAASSSTHTSGGSLPTAASSSTHTSGSSLPKAASSSTHTSAGDSSISCHVSMDHSGMQQLPPEASAMTHLLLTGQPPPGHHTTGAHPMETHTPGMETQQPYWAVPVVPGGAIPGVPIPGVPIPGVPIPSPQHTESTPRPPEEFYEKEGYQIRIENAVRFKEKSDEAAVVEMKSGTQFKIKICNNNNYDTEIEVTIDGRFIWLMSLPKKGADVIESDMLEGKKLAFYGNVDSQSSGPMSVDIGKSIIRCVFKPDATSLCIKWPNGPEKTMAFQRKATVGEVFSAVNCRLRKEGKNGEVQGLIKVDGEMKLVWGREEKQECIGTNGLTSGKKAVVAVTNKEKLYIQMPDDQPEAMMIMDPINTRVAEIQKFIASKLNGSGATEERISLWIGDSLIDERQSRMTLLSTFAESDHPVLAVQVAPEWKIQVKKESEDETHEMIVHAFMRISDLYTTLISKGLCQAEERLYCRDKDITDSCGTLEDERVQHEDVITIRPCLGSPPLETMETGERSTRGGGFVSDVEANRKRGVGFSSTRGLDNSGTRSVGTRSVGTRSVGTRSLNTSRDLPSDSIAPLSGSSALGRIRLEGNEDHSFIQNYQVDSYTQNFEEALKTEIIIKIHECM